MADVNTKDAEEEEYPYSGANVPPWATEADVAAATATLMSAIDPKRYVGTKHHVVPRFILKRFANERDQVRVRYRDRRGHHLCNIKDLAVTDFYTFIDHFGELDASFEQLWGEIEAAAATVLRNHIEDPFLKPHPFALHEKQAIDALVALQSQRGPAMRRTSELIADYGMKIVNQDKMSTEELLDLEFRPSQNHHLQTMAGLMDKVEKNLSTRSAFIVTLDRPLLVTCDEPVFLERPETYAPPTRSQMRDYPPDILVDGKPVPREDIIQFHNPRGVGFDMAEAIVMPIGPCHAVVYGEPGTAAPVPHRKVGGKDADHFAQELLKMCIEQSVMWIAGHPDHGKIANLRIPKTQPPIYIFDGGTAFSHAARTSIRRAPRRLDKDARPEPDQN